MSTGLRLQPARNSGKCSSRDRPPGGSRRGRVPHDGGSVWKRRYDFVFLPAGIPAAMIEMQMRIHHNVDIGRSQTVLAQALIEKGAIDAVNIAEPRVHLVARAGFDQYPPAARVNQQAVHRQRYAISRVSWRLLFPDRLRDHAEHGSAVEQHVAPVNDMEFEFAKLHTRLLERISCAAEYGSFVRAATSVASFSNAAETAGSPRTRSTSRVSIRRNNHSFQ